MMANKVGRVYPKSTFDSFSNKPIRELVKAFVLDPMGNKVWGVTGSLFSKASVPESFRINDFIFLYNRHGKAGSPPVL